VKQRTPWVIGAIWTVTLGAFAAAANAQDAPSAVSPAPATAISSAERVDWIIDGTVGPQSLLLVGPVSAAWSTAWNTPEEWGQTWEGFGKRYLQREADVAISSTLEAGLGAIWGEDPRFVPSHRDGVWPRARFAMKTVFLAPRRDGHLAPAWGRFAGNVFNNVIENTWLPPSATTPEQTAFRSIGGLGGRLLGNLWNEFWPDVRERLAKRRR
jgi:hypothetical protein